VKSILISNENVKAQILPSCGGRLTSLVVDNQEIMYVNQEQLLKGSVEGGGNPILFPICSGLKNKRYMIDGKEYTMPNHGFVYNKPWNVDAVKEDSVTLSIKWDDDTIKMYPFKFKVELTYEVKEYGVSLIQRVYNYSENDMPFYMGYHPFFKMDNLEDSELFIKSSKYIDYDDQIWYEPEYKENGALVKDLSTRMDDVHYGIDNKCAIGLPTSKAIKISYDDAMKNVVVWRPKESDFLCVEPWMSDPDAFNKGSKGIANVKPNDSIEILFGIELE
jgi:galactose mutarotase-like enzyme